ncbi:unnamed protein product [Mucor fragilis]
MSTSQEQASEIEQQLSQAKKNNVIRFRNELLLKEIQKVENQASWYSNNPEMAHINDDPSYSKDHYHATWTKPSN